MIRGFIRWLRELPLRIVEWTADGLEWLFRWFSGIVDVGGDQKGPVGLWGGLRRGIVGLFWVGVRLVSYPVSGLFLRGVARRAYWCSMPSVFLGLVVVGLLVVWGVYRERVLTRYLVRVQSAYTRGQVAGIGQTGEVGLRDTNETGGIGYAERWIDDPKFVTPEKELLFGLVQLQSGGVERGMRVLELLSPEDGKGLGVAHYWRAGEYAQRVRKGLVGQGEELQENLLKLRWHVERAGGVAEGQLALLRGRLAGWEGDTAGAEFEFRKAWQESPGVGLEIAEMYRGRGEEESARRILVESGQRLMGLVSAEPRNRVAREQLAVVYEGLGEWGRAEGVLLEGLQWSRDATGYELLLGHYLRRLDKGVEDPIDYRSISYVMMRLARAQGASAKLVIQRVGDRIQGLVQDRGLEEVLGRLQEENQGWLVDGGDPALAHLGLGLIEWSRGEMQRGRWHVEQAMRIDVAARGCAERIVEELQGRLREPWVGRLEDFARWIRVSDLSDPSTSEDSSRDRP